MSDEKKLGDFSRPDSVAFPAEEEPAETQPVDPEAWPSPPDEPPVTRPVEPPTVDSWQGSNEPAEDWSAASWEPDAPPEPVFQPPAAPESESPPDDFEDPRRPDQSRREGVSPLLVGAVILLIALLSVAAWWFFAGRKTDATDESRSAAPPSSAPAPPPPAPVGTTEPPPKPDLPPLDASDPTVRSWLSTLSVHPQLVQWLTPDDLIRRFVTSVDNISRGRSPRPHLGVLEPEGGFEVTRRNGTLVAAPGASSRYDLLVEVFSSLDIAAGARLYYDVEPLLEEAYQELGDPSRDFRGALTAAIDRLLAVPVPDEPPELEKGVLTYRYADPELEALDPAAKHLLRLGPENARKVQSKLRFFRAALDLPDDSS